MSRRDFGEGEFTVHLVSSAFMSVFTDNTLANFETISLVKKSFLTVTGAWH